jgi:hypothetical protein
MTDFNTFVQQWYALATQIADLKAQLKPLERQEMELRKALAESVNKAVPLQEGVNNYPLPGGRVLKITYSLDRKVLPEHIEEARTEYNRLNSVPCAFDDLLRMNYEVNIKQFRKLDGPAALTFSRVLETKPRSPTIVLD